MVEIKKGLYVCPKFGFGIEIPANLSDGTANDKILEQTAGIVADILEDCSELGAVYHNPHCLPNCPIQSLVEPLNNLLTTKK